MKISFQTRRKIVWIICLCGLLSFGAYLLVGPLVRSNGALHRRLHQARSLAVACKLYASDHGGNYPERLPDLIPQYVDRPQILEFPLTDNKRLLTYQYFGGKETDPPHTVLLRVSPESPGGMAVVVYSDTTGATLPEVKVK